MSKILRLILNSNITIVKDYETENKVIKDAYIIFKKEYMIPDNLFELIQNDESLKYYYSEQERIEYINMWSTKKTNSFTSYTVPEYNLYRSISNENIGYNVLQSNHYMDVGCNCRACNYKRKNIIEKINNGEQNTDKIIHEVVKSEYLQNVRIPNIKKKISYIIMQKQKQQINKRHGISKTIMKF